jgi:enoyl-[acyl-carrier protein] reductase I
MRALIVVPGAGITVVFFDGLPTKLATLRKQAVRTEEVASAVAFLLSPRSSGINAQGLVIDAGMSTNYFDDELVQASTR